MKLSQLVSKFDAMDIGNNNVYPSLTDDQKKIHDDVFNEYKSNVKFALLDARSGSGKTTTIRAIEKKAKELDITVHITASTGKASSALGGRTIHSYLGLKMIQNDNAIDSDDALILKRSESASIVGKPDILIIDESSMIGMTLFNEIKKENFKYVLFVMDSNQLPPVKEKAVKWDNVVQSRHFLTKTLRAQDHDMVKLFNDFKDYKDGVIESLDLQDYINNRNIVKIDYSDCDFIPKNSDSCCVSYRNKLVEFMANKTTVNGHNKYNLNNGINITKMIANLDIIDKNGYYKRTFESEQFLFNGEDVQIDILSNETRAIEKNGYCMYKDFKISMSKTGTGITISKINGTIEQAACESAEDKYYINLPTNEVLEHCMLSIVNNKYFILLWDSSEDEYKNIVEELFVKLRPHLDIHRGVKKYIEHGDKTFLIPEVSRLIDHSDDLEDFLINYQDHSISVERKRAWNNFLSAKNVVTARYTTSRTINKAQGMSVPCVVLTNNSFYGASVSAQYVAVTRGKHGIIFIDNVPNIVKGEEDE